MERSSLPVMSQGFTVSLGKVVVNDDRSSFKFQPAEPEQLTRHHPEPLSSQKIEDGSGELSTCMVLPAQKQANTMSQSVSNCVGRLPGLVVSMQEHFG